jgi:hypothetical protein
LRKRREPPVVISEIKPPTLPPFVRRRKDGRDVLQRPRLPQLEDAATGPHRHANCSLPHRRGKKLRRKEMGPQVPVGGNPQISFTNRREDGCLRDGVGTEIVQLHPVDVQDRPHKNGLPALRTPAREMRRSSPHTPAAGTRQLRSEGPSTPAVNHRREGKANHQQQWPPGHPP